MYQKSYKGISYYNLTIIKYTIWKGHLHKYILYSLLESIFEKIWKISIVNMMSLTFLRIRIESSWQNYWFFLIIVRKKYEYKFFGTYLLVDYLWKYIFDNYSII